MSAPARSMAIDSAPEPTPDSSTRAAGEDVGQQQDRPEVLRIDDLGAAGHLEDELRQRRPDDRVVHPVAGPEGRALGRADDGVVAHGARVRVELLAGHEGDQVAALLRVDEQDLLALAAGVESSRSPPERDRHGVGPGRSLHEAAEGADLAGRRGAAALARLQGGLLRRPRRPRSARTPGRGSRSRSRAWCPATAPRWRSAPPCSRGACCRRPSGTPRRCSRCPAARSRRPSPARPAARAASPCGGSRCGPAAPGSWRPR